MNAAKMFGRLNEEGNVDVFNEDGSIATRIDATVYPVGSAFSTRWEHPNGITLTVSDAGKILKNRIEY